VLQRGPSKAPCWAVYSPSHSFADTQGSFADIWGSFADTQGSFADIGQHTPPHREECHESCEGGMLHHYGCVMSESRGGWQGAGDDVGARPHLSAHLKPFCGYMRLF